MNELRDSKALQADEELAYWLEYRKSNNGELRSQLITYYIPFAQSIAANTYKLRTLKNVDYKDYVQYAMLGLIEAVDKFKPDQGTSFKTYSSYRIRGAILNGLAKDSELSAQIKFNKTLKDERLDSLLERATMSDDEDKQDLIVEMQNLIVPLAIQYALDNSLIEQSQNRERSEDTPYQNYAFAELKQNLLKLVDSLPEKHQQVIKYHYLGHIHFDKIAQVMALSKGRISQIHKEAIYLLRDLSQELKDFDFRF